MQAVWFERNGDPSVLATRESPPPEPEDGQLLVSLVAAGVNYRDIYERRGGYGSPPPAIVGVEGAGTVAAVGRGVTNFQVGDRISWLDVPGSTAEKVAVPASRALLVPDDVSLECAAAITFQGITAHYLCTSTYKVQGGEWVIVHAAAGGVGRLLLQLIKRAGAKVIATASPEKLSTARDAGADIAVSYSDVVEAAADMTDGAGVAAVFDGVGAPTFAASLQCLRPRGMLVLFGAAGGPPAPIEVSSLAQRSLYVTRPALPHYGADGAELQRRADEVFGAVAEGEIDVLISRRYKFEEARIAHADLEGRLTTGKLLLVPSDV